MNNMKQSIMPENLESISEKNESGVNTSKMSENLAASFGIVRNDEGIDSNQNRLQAVVEEEKHEENKYSMDESSNLSHIN